MIFFISIFISLMVISVSAGDDKEYIVTGSDVTETKELSKVFEKMALGKH